MRVGEAPAVEIRHRVGLAPDDVVEDPEAEILQDRADAEDVVIAADDPKRPVRLQKPPAFAEPGTREIVVSGEIGEFVPIRLDTVDPAVIWSVQIAAELEVIRRVGEDKVDR